MCVCALPHLTRARCVCSCGHRCLPQRGSQCGCTTTRRAPARQAHSQSHKPRHPHRHVHTQTETPLRVACPRVDGVKTGRGEGERDGGGMSAETSKKREGDTNASRPRKESTRTKKKTEETKKAAQKKCYGERRRWGATEGSTQNRSEPKPAVCSTRLRTHVHTSTRARIATQAHTTKTHTHTRTRTRKDTSK